MPISPNSLEHMAFYTLNQVPAPLLEVFNALAFRIVQAAIRLRVFEALEVGPLTVTQLAQQISANPHGTQMLLESLQALGYIRQQEGRYVNSAMTSKWMLNSAPKNVSVAFEYWSTVLFNHFNDLEETICRGQPAANYYEYIEGHPEESQLFQSWLIAAARLGVDEIADKIKLPGTAKRLLDVGGGHGMYSIALCRRHPHLSATIFDAPQALKSAQVNIASEKLTDRITTQVGDFMHDDLGDGYDVALLFNIIHGLSPEQNVDLFRRVARALKPGARLVIGDQFTGAVGGPAVQAVTQIFGLSFFQLLGARVYPFEDAAIWLSSTGFAQAQRIKLVKNPGISIILSTRQWTD